MNGSTGKMNGSHRSSAPDPIDRAREALAESRQATKLLEYSEDFDEPTGRTDVQVHLHHAPFSSQPDGEQRISTVGAAPKSDPPARAGLIGVVVVFVKSFPPWGSVLVALAALAGYVFLRSRGMAP